MSSIRDRPVKAVLMSEFQLAGGGSAATRSGPPSQHGNQVEWYQAGGASTSYANTGADYTFAPPTSGGYISTNDNFTDEAPLLEGQPGFKLTDQGEQPACFSSS